MGGNYNRWGEWLALCGRIMSDYYLSLTFLYIPKFFKLMHITRLVMKNIYFFLPPPHPQTAPHPRLLSSVNNTITHTLSQAQNLGWFSPALYASPSADGALHAALISAALS